MPSANSSLISAAVLLGCLVSLAAAETPPARGVSSLRPADRWENGFVTGNGNLGAIVCGHPDKETIIGNDSRLFLPLVPTHKSATTQYDRAANPGASVARRFLPDISALLPQVRDIIRKEGSPAGYITAQKLVWEEAKKQGYMGYQFPGNYHAGFKLHLDMPAHGPIRGILARGQLRIDTLVWDKPKGRIHLELTSAIPQQIILALPQSQSIAAIESLETQPRRRDETAWEVTLSPGKPATLDITFVNPTP